MEPVAALVGEAVGAMAVRDPVIPVLSPTGPREVTDAAGVRAVLADALASPVAWSQALTGGARRWPVARWRECGPSASLYPFVWKNRLDLDWAEA
jgi:malonyl CoA-acyl carrier protein transacylase